MHEYDEIVVKVFFEKQGQLFPEQIATTIDQAENFLEEATAVVVNSMTEVWEYFDGEGIDMEGADEEAIIEADEVFDIGDGRYLIVEG